MKEYLMHFVTWSGFWALILSILHLLPILCGAIGAVFWLFGAYYKYRKEKIAMEIAEVQLQKEKEK